jgi:hypothetical protein
MALVDLVNLTEILLNQTAGQAQGLQAETPSKASANNGATAATGDQFTPSAENTAQAAGLFTVNQFTLFSAAAEFLLAQAPAPRANPANASAPAANFTAPPATQEAVATNIAAALQAPAAAPARATPAPANALAANAAAAPATTTANIQSQLQALNNALAALGLSKEDIRKIDGIAGSINDFNPAAFNSLVSQLVALTRQVAPQAAVNTANTNAANANATQPNAGGLQVQELRIRFSGVPAQGTLGGTNNATGGTGNVRAPGPNIGPFPVSAFTLQVEEVQLSLTDNNGHTVRVRAPAEAVNANPPASGNQALAQTRAATA